MPKTDVDTVIDAEGKYVIPGAIDVHTHMDIDVGIARAVDDFYDGISCSGMWRYYFDCRSYGIWSGRSSASISSMSIRN